MKETSVQIAELEQRSANMYRAGEQYKQKKLDSMRKHLERLKVQADINDPAVKRKFEDGLGKPQSAMWGAVSIDVVETNMCNP